MSECARKNIVVAAAINNLGLFEVYADLAKFIKMLAELREIKEQTQLL